MRLLLTRPLSDSKTLKKKLEGLGHQVWSLPLIAIKPPRDGGLALRKACAQISKYQWLLLNSKNAAQALTRYVKKFPKNLRVVRVGKEGVKGLIEFFENKKIAGQRVLYPLSQIGRKELVIALRKKGAKVDVVEAYQTKATKITSQQIQSILNKKIDGVLFYSPSAVQFFFNKAGRQKRRLKNLKFVPIGKTTAQAIKAHGYKPSYNLSGII